MWQREWIVSRPQVSTPHTHRHRFDQENNVGVRPAVSITGITTPLLQLPQSSQMLEDLEQPLHWQNSFSYHFISYCIDHRVYKHASTKVGFFCCSKSEGFACTISGTVLCS